MPPAPSAQADAAGSLPDACQMLQQTQFHDIEPDQRHRSDNGKTERLANWSDACVPRVNPGVFQGKPR